MNAKHFRKLFAGCLLLCFCAKGLSAQDSQTTDTTEIPAARMEPGRFFPVAKAVSTAAVSTVSGGTLYETVSPGISNTLYGRLPGLTVTQSNGIPGNDAALLNIRGVGSYAFGATTNGYSTYKIFVDGFEVNASYFNGLSAAEIESISIFKDAASLATFGMRGANGVVWVTTGRARIHKPTVRFQTRAGVQQPIEIYKPLNSYNYARLYNQAISNDAGSWSPVYSESQLAAYQNGSGTDVDWYDAVLKNSAAYHDADLVFSGGDSTARYNVVFDYLNQQGLYDVANTDSSSNQFYRRFNIRTNLDFNLFKIFEASVDVSGRLGDSRQPNFNTTDLWNNLARYPSNIYNIYDSVDRWSGTSLYPNNPAASINALGWTAMQTRNLQGNFRLKEKLDMLTPGLYLQEAYSFNSYAVSSYSKTATYARYSNGSTTTTDQKSPIRAQPQVPAGQEDWKQLLLTAGYANSFGKNRLDAALNFHQSDFRGDGNYGFAYHYQNLSGRVHLVNNDKYIAEFGFSYFGSDAYAPGNRWGFYPAVSAGWVISNEDFLTGNNLISFMKLRGSIGKTAASDVDAGASPQGQNGRFLYQQYYQAGSPLGSFYTGNGSPTAQGLLSPLYLANPAIFAEQSVKYDLGLDLTLFKKLSLTVDVYLDKRSGIITKDNSIPGSFGVNNYFANVGSQTNKGIEASLQYDEQLGRTSLSLFGLIAYNKNTIDYMAEVMPPNAFTAMTGRAFGTPIGLQATGYYQLSDFNADGSLKEGVPSSSFGSIAAGDLRYEDLDGNGRIDDNDRTAIGFPRLPQLTYSFGTKLRFAGLDLSVLFQGVHGTSVNLLQEGQLQSRAFLNNGNVYPLAENAWAYYPDQGIDTRATATYPRLTATANNNNYQLSNFWIKSGDFLRIRNIELGYEFANSLLHSKRIEELRLFVSAVNPVTWSSLLSNYHMDPEAVSGYPALKSYNAGISVTF